MTRSRKANNKNQDSLWKPRWQFISGRDAVSDNDLIDSCLDLYAENYGKWAEGQENSGQPIRISRSKLISRLDDDAVRLACAYHDNRLVGYCIAVWSHMPGRGIVAWVSQLVVEKTYRDDRIATRLLYGFWQFSDCYAWGIATANPYAIRALETATRRPCRRAEIVTNGPQVLSVVAEHVPYLPKNLAAGKDGRPAPRVNTEFFQDQSEVPTMKRKAGRGDRPWSLGNLADGEEWFACTFSHQDPQEMDNERLSDLLVGADSIWLQAYEGMTLDDDHAWHTHSEEEVEYIVERTELAPGSRVLDVGCGDGRHIGSFAKRGFKATGIDISEHLIDLAEIQVVAGRDLRVMDARSELPDGEFDLVTCLYDVMGSSARAEDDLLIIKNVSRSLAPGGFFVASVMNDGATRSRLKPGRQPTTNRDFVKALEGLPPSSTMEQTGSVFDPEFLLLFDGVYYRKEQFQDAQWKLPSELVVRDRRFDPTEIKELVLAAGLELLTIKAVQSGNWHRIPSLHESDLRAKELLFIARKPHDDQTSG